jgi:mono/diheme cytochrome c family protein
MRLKHLTCLIFLAALIFLFVAACKASPPEPLYIPPDDLAPEKQEYYQLGLIELVPDDMPMPEISLNPTQADLGEMPYYQVCMACHGNWGQGLTDEWREIGFGEDKNCWQSKCHAPNHPSQGFVLPRYVPPVLGQGTMPTIENAEQLYTIIYETMPWWDPGFLSKEDSLALTAYLMRARGELPNGVVLTENNLAAFDLVTSAPQIVDEKPGAIALIVFLAIGMVSFMWKKQ